MLTAMTDLREDAPLSKEKEEAEVYSHSRLSTFEQCPRKYRYRYVDKLPVEVETIEAFMGRKVHETLEALYSSIKSGRLIDESELIEFHEENWRNSWNGGILISKTGYTEQDYLLKSVQSIRRYYSKHYPFDRAETKATELEIRFAIDGEGRFLMKGFIDRLDRRDDGVYEIHDYKCSSFLPSPYRLMGDRQLPLYQIAVQSLYPDAARVELVWHYLLFDRSFRTVKTSAQLELVKKRSIETIEAILAADDFPPVRSKLCAWCEFSHSCNSESLA